MTEEQQKNVLNGIQAALEEMKDSGDDILFLESKGNRGLISGSVQGLAALFAYNMAAYPVFKLIIGMAEELYGKHRKELESFVSQNRPPHELIDNYGNDFSMMLKQFKNNQDQTKQ